MELIWVLETDQGSLSFNHDIKSLRYKQINKTGHLTLALKLLLILWRWREGEGILTLTVVQKAEVKAWIMRDKKSIWIVQSLMGTKWNPN